MYIFFVVEYMYGWKKYKSPQFSYPYGYYFIVQYPVHVNFKITCSGILNPNGFRGNDKANPK